MKLLLPLLTMKWGTIFYLIMHFECTTLHIQNVDIETLQTHCYTLIAYSLGSAAFPTCTGCLMVLVFGWFPCVFEPPIHLERSALKTMCSLLVVVDVIPRVILALTVDLGTVHSSFGLFSSIWTAKFLQKSNIGSAGTPFKSAIRYQSMRKGSTIEPS